MANVGKALARALGVFGTTLVSAKQEQADREMESRIKNFYMKQAEKQAQYAAEAAERAREDQLLQRQKYDADLQAEQQQRTAMVKAMEQLGLSGTPEDLAARQAISDLTREQRQREKEAAETERRTRESVNARATNLVAAEVPESVAWEIAELERQMDDGSVTPEIKARHAQLMKDGGQASARAKVALEADVNPQTTRLPDGMLAQLAAVLGSTPDGQRKMARFRQIQAMPDKDRTPEIQAEYDSILSTLAQEETNPLSTLKSDYDMNEKLLDSLAPEDDFGTRTMPVDPASQERVKVLMERQLGLTDQYLSLAGGQQESAAPAAPTLPPEMQKRAEGEQAAQVAADAVRQSTGRDVKKQFVVMPGREPVEFNADDPNLGRVLLKNKDARVQLLDGTEQVSAQASALERDAQADGTLLGEFLRSANRGLNQVFETTGIHPLNPLNIIHPLNPLLMKGGKTAVDTVTSPETYNTLTSPETYNTFNRWLLGGN